jgi:hypothetical protein
VRLPPLAAPYCETYQYRIDTNHVITLWGKQGDTFHVGMAMHLNLLRNLYERVMTSAAEMSQRQQQANATAQKAAVNGKDEPKLVEPEPAKSELVETKPEEKQP